MSGPKQKLLLTKLKGLRTKSEDVQKPKKVKRKKDSELIEALSYKVEDVATSLCQRNVISERKEENILCLHGPSLKAQFLMEVLNRKGQQAMDALYQVVCNFRMWRAADILEPGKAPHDRPVVCKSRKAIDDPSLKELTPEPVTALPAPQTHVTTWKSIDDHHEYVNIPSERKVSFYEENVDTECRQEGDCINGSSSVLQNGGAPVSQDGNVDEHRDSPETLNEDTSLMVKLMPEPDRAPPAPRPHLTTRKSLNDDHEYVNIPIERKVSSYDKEDGTECRQEGDGLNGASSVLQNGDAPVSQDGNADERRDIPDNTVVNESEDSGFESRQESSLESEQNVSDGHESNDASCEESEPGSDDKLNPHSKTQGRDVAGNEVPCSLLVSASQSERTYTKSTSMDEKQNEKNMKKESEFEALLNSTPSVDIEKPNANWTDVGGLDELKKLISEADEQFMRSHTFPQLKTYLHSSLRNFLLFGPDTDMKHIARAIAKQQSYSCIISFSSADLVSVWTEERIITAVFKHAKAKQPCIIFISEIDFLSTSKSQPAERIRCEFLQQITSVVADDKILVFGATNKPWAVDCEIKREFGKQVYICLPDASLRKEIFSEWFHTTRGAVLTSTYAGVEELARQTDGYSRAQINALLRKTLMQSLREVQNATFFKKVSGWMLCSPNDPGAIEMTWNDVPDDKLLKPIITEKDVLDTLADFEGADKESHTKYERYMRE